MPSSLYPRPLRRRRLRLSTEATSSSTTSTSSATGGESVSVDAHLRFPNPNLAQSYIGALHGLEASHRLRPVKRDGVLGRGPKSGSTKVVFLRPVAVEPQRPPSSPGIDSQPRRHRPVISPEELASLSDAQRCSHINSNRFAADRPHKFDLEAPSSSSTSATTDSREISEGGPPAAVVEKNFTGNSPGVVVVVLANRQRFSGLSYASIGNMSGLNEVYSCNNGLRSCFQGICGC
ncbi:uncharacterized protein A4U43_C01F20240 [Asparagus officinalis]|uniref:Uncharacterized protein n=1 Tax=Asparagus officinalis TaxID=4686 RepID=A0A5P1FQS6_ASPOF|nr:uncharacterized protein A4U43_C01F20240 [Asparagus officinalis]